MTLVLFGARWYNPATGMWLSEDPLGFTAGDANLYRYVKNQPTDNRDPTGQRTGTLRSAASSTTPGTPPALVNAPEHGQIQVLVLVDVKDKGTGEWLSAVGADFERLAKKYPYIPIEPNDFEATVKAVENVVDKYGRVRELRIYDHGFDQGGQQIGDEELCMLWRTEAKKPLVRRLLRCIDNGGTLKLYGCCAGKAQTDLQKIADDSPHLSQIWSSSKESVWRIFTSGNEPWINFNRIFNPKKRR